MVFSMRPSRVLRKLRDGDIVNCFKLNLADIRVTQIVASFGFDCLWTCMEHVPNDLSVIEALTVPFSHFSGLTKQYHISFQNRPS